MPRLAARLAALVSSWQLWLARRSQEEAGPLGAPPLPRVLERAASSTAADVIPPPVDPSLLLYFSTSLLLYFSTLVRHDAFPEDKDSSDEMVFGDDDNLDDYN